MNIGFIGFGNMAQAIVNGMVNKANIDPSLIHVCSAHFDSCQKNAHLGYSQYTYCGWKRNSCHRTKTFFTAGIPGKLCSAFFNNCAD